MRYRSLRFPDGKPKAVTFSYDDGVCQDKRLSEIFCNYGLKCTFNINSTRISETDGAHNTSANEIRSFLLEKGHEIAVHGAIHQANGVVRAVEGIKEVLDCRLTLEKEFGIIVRGMAYPDSGVSHFHNGMSYQAVKQYLTELDIVYARALGEKNESLELPSDWHYWLPTAHHNDANVFELIDRFLNIKLVEVYLPRATPKLFYLWGHSYEFDNNNNWDRIEQIAEKLSGKEDIWYATNMEIYNYVNAYNSLIYSADCKTVYNPTLIELWFDVDRKLYSVKPGQTIKITD